MTKTSRQSSRALYESNSNFAVNLSAEQMIQHMAFHDQLTGLANRVLLTQTITDTLEQRSHTQSSLAILFIDLDQFKSINDTRGHSFGDELLIQVALRLRECVHFEKDMICRLGGDEFIVLLRDIEDLNRAKHVAEKIIGSFTEPFDVAEEPVFITGSIGIALAVDADANAERLIKNADIAMYEAKNKGKNTYQFFDQSLNDKIQERFHMEKSLRSALELDEFVLHYQPQICAETYELTGVEALIRWDSPEKGFIHPGKFIQVAEDSGFIIELGRWVIREACIQMKKWSDMGLNPFRVSINLSPRQFQDKNIVEHFREALLHANINGKWLGIEITETGIIHDVEHARKTLLELREMGITIDIDDFGTGYSSFRYLMDLPVDKIKIDQTFVRDISKKNAAAIVRSIIALAKNLDIRSIAEGVETESQVMALKEFGCDELQGYLIHKPGPAENLEQLLMSGNQSFTTLAKLPTI